MAPDAGPPVRFWMCGVPRWRRVIPPNRDIDPCAPIETAHNDKTPHPPRGVPAICRAATR
jgi:hypothetical protein